MYRHLRRTDLFLVRVWREDAGDTADAAGGDRGKTQWGGAVQRVVDGETHQFNSWRDLIELLLTMLSTNKGR